MGILSNSNVLGSTNKSKLLPIVKKAIILFSLLFGLFTASSSFAQGIADEKEFGLFIGQLMNVSEELTEADVEKIRSLKEFKYSETATALLVRMNRLIDDVSNVSGNNAGRIAVINAVLNALDSTITTEHNILLNEITENLVKNHLEYLGKLYVSTGDKVQENLNNPQRRIYFEQELKGLDKALKILKHVEKVFASTKATVFRDGRVKLPEMTERPQAYDFWLNKYNQNKENNDLDLTQLRTVFLEDVERMDRYMRERVIDQDQAIESLLKLELDLHVRGYVRERPVIRFLMGLPGTGKDTIAEAYVDAKFKKKGAHNEHLFRFPTIRSQHDVWGVIGSGKGYVGSSGPLPEFIQFLVEHSGGRYKYGDNKKMTIEENRLWKPGAVLPGYFAPEDAVVFINEGHNWSQQAFDILLKQALEKGYFKVNSSNGGLEKIFVPVTFLFASNHGISSMVARDESGRVNGKVKTYVELEETWQILKDDKVALRNALYEFNGQPAAGHGETLGMSEEFGNRIRDEELILMRPLSPDGLKKIIRLKFADLAETFKAGQSGFGYLDLELSEELVKFIQEYRYNPEAGARPMEDKLQVVIDELYAAIKSKELRHNGVKQIYLDIENNADKTKTLVFKYGENRTSVLIRRVLPITLRDQALEKASYEEFERLAGLPDLLQQKIYGNPEAMKGLGEAVAITQMAREVYMKNREEHKRATTFGLFGYAGLGKTQSAKELTKALTGSEDFMIVDFNYIDSIEKFEQEFIGVKKGSQVIKSKFMNEYDKKMGSTMVVLLEEVANAHPEILKRLYPFFDESVVRVFKDGKERPMSNVIFLATGNAGIEIYEKVMQMDLPRTVKMAALGWVYEEFLKNPEAQHKVLSQKIPIPLITRFTDIYHYRPINNEILRNLSQRFLADGIESLKPKDGLVGWNVGFRTESDYYKLIDIIENEGFEFANQGRSVRNYIDRNIQSSLKLLLVKNRIPEGANVVLVPRPNQDFDTLEANKWKVQLDVYVEGKSEPILFEMEAQRREREMKESREAHKRTAGHEAGHNINMRFLFPDKMKTEFLSIIPGVTEIMNEYIYYAGVAVSHNQERIEYTRQAVVQLIAVKYGGAVAEQILSKGEVDTAGKHNDMEGATFLAKRAVMEWGLSPRFKKNINMKDQAALNLLSKEDKTIISEEVDRLLSEGEALSRKLLESNFDLLVSLTNTLLEKGNMNRKEIDTFYEKNAGLVRPLDNAYRASHVGIWTRMARSVMGIVSRSQVKDHNPVFKDKVTLTTKIANIDDIVEEARQKELSRVPKPVIPIFANVKSVAMRLLTNESTASITRVVSCQALFR